MKLNPARRRLVTIGVATVILVAFVLAGSLARVPYVALSPGPTVNTLGTLKGKPVVEVTGGVDEKRSEADAGNLNLTTVSLRDEITLFQAIGMWFSSTYELQPREVYIPAGKTNEEVDQENAEQMTSSEDNATAAALTYLKRPVAVGVRTVADGSPAVGRLEPGDVIVSFAGQPVSTGQELVDAVRARKPGDTVQVVVDRKGGRQDVQVTLGARPEDPAVAYLGTTFKLVSGDPNVKISYNVEGIGGPSAGLMLTLAVIDLLTTGDLAHGKFIAGTGTIVPDGTVGAIGGIQHKIKAAKEAGATAFLVPAENCTEAKDGAPDGLELIKVGKLGEAVDALGALDSGAPRPHC